VIASQEADVRLGVLSDVHGNRPALETAINWLERRGVEGWLCAGDLVGYGPEPAACVERVLGLGAHTVAGNHELIVLGELGVDRCTPSAAASLRWTRAALDASTLARIGTLPRRTVLESGVALTHGSWADPQEYVHTLAAAQATLRAVKEDAPTTRVLVVGHTHQAFLAGLHAGVLLHRRPGTVRLPEDDVVLLNPGAVGQTRGGPPRARVALLDLRTRTAEFAALRYDTGAVRRALREHGLPPDAHHVSGGLRGYVGHTAYRLRARR
jgi:predicted phosphodiesterase